MNIWKENKLSRLLQSWKGCFLLSAVVMLLQLIPLIGFNLFIFNGISIFLMIALAPFWPILLVNLGFGLMAWDSLRARQPRWLAIFPLLWFGGYLVATLISHWQVDRFNQDIIAANAGKKIAFDQSNLDVLLERSREDIDYSYGIGVSDLVTLYGIEQAYELKLDKGTVQRSRLVLEPCPPRKARTPGNDIYWRHPSDDGSRLRAHGLCYRSEPATPDKPVIRVRILSTVKSGGLIHKVLQDIEIKPPVGEPISLRAGWASALRWFPQPVYGCGLNSGAASWDCVAGFQHEPTFDRDRELRPNRARNVIIQALGLTKATLRERYPQADWR